MKKVIFKEHHSDEYTVHDNYYDFCDSSETLYAGFENNAEERYIFISDELDGAWLYHPFNGIMKVRPVPKGTFFTFSNLEELFDWILFKK